MNVITGRIVMIHTDRRGTKNLQQSTPNTPHVVFFVARELQKLVVIVRGRLRNSAQFGGIRGIESNSGGNRRRLPSSDGISFQRKGTYYHSE